MREKNLTPRLDHLTEMTMVLISSGKKVTWNKKMNVKRGTSAKSKMVKRNASVRFQVHRDRLILGGG